MKPMKHGWSAWLGLLLACVVLGGCATLDPEGDWRGTPEARARSCQALLDRNASVGQMKLVAVAPASEPVGGQCAAGGTVAAGAMATGATVAGVALSLPRAQDRAGSSKPKRTPSATELSRLAALAERAYTEGRHDEAATLLEELIDAEPGNAFVWLRRGNALHRLEQWDAAALSYRRASELAVPAPSPGREPDPARVEVRSKANANLAILGIDQARRALEALGPRETDPIAAAHRNRIEAALRAVVKLPTTVRPASDGPLADPAPRDRGGSATYQEPLRRDLGSAIHDDEVRSNQSGVSVSRRAAAAPQSVEPPQPGRFQPDSNLSYGGPSAELAAPGGPADSASSMRSPVEVIRGLIQ